MKTEGDEEPDTNATEEPTLPFNEGEAEPLKEIPIEKADILPLETDEFPALEDAVPDGMVAPPVFEAVDAGRVGKPETITVVEMKLLLEKAEAAVFRDTVPEGGIGPPLEAPETALCAEIDITLPKEAISLTVDEGNPPLGVLGTVTKVSASSKPELPLPELCSAENSSLGLQYPNPVAQLRGAQYSSVLPQYP